jgi:nucleoside-diphosphate-sugar epimerase
MVISSTAVAAPHLLPTRRVLVTGATGFVGARLANALRASGQEVIALVRAPSNLLAPEVQQIAIHDIASGIPERALEAVDTVIHTAARVHVMKERASDALAEFRRVNVTGTVAAANAAAAAGVRRFIFLSSVKVHGETSSLGRPFYADDTPSPNDAYAQSKYEAELSLTELAASSGMSYCIIRPPLVYGPGVRANFQQLIKWVEWGVPLPLGAIERNRRSFVFVDNLIDLVVRCSHHPNAANQAFLVSDGQDLSTRDLLVAIASAVEKRHVLIRVPEGVLRVLGKMLLQSDLVARLCDSLQVDITKTRELLAWAPSISVADGLRQTVRRTS